MKILFLHIGDMHVKDRKCINSFQIKKIADALNCFCNYDQIILIIAGDIAYSGTKEQYKYAEYLVGTLISEIKKVCNYSKKIDVLCVPGNHDLDHNGSPMTSEFLQGIRKVNSYDKHLPNELKKQEAFFSFACRNSCFTDKSVFDRKVLKYSDFTIEVNMINSGVFSILEEDKALHYIPMHYINEISLPTKSDFVITVMHHSPEWYVDDLKNNLEEVIYSKSSIVFYGHEHYIAKKTIAYESNAPAIIQAGGCLCENENWSTSSFHAGEFDTNTRIYKHIEYRWNPRHKQYEPYESFDDTLPYKPSIEKNLEITETFKKDLLIDTWHDISTDFRDYYVFPRIQSEERISGNNREFTNHDTFIDEILNKKKIIITGGYNSGKTLLLKALMLQLVQRNYIVLFCDIDNIRGKKAERIIRNCFEDIYGDKESDYKRYEQIPKERKVLIIDDFDQIKSSSLDMFMSQIGEKFEYFIFSSKELIDVSLLERTKAQLKAVDSIYRYKIMPLYADKRQELIERVVKIKATDPSSVAKISKILTEAITAQRRFINLDPDFIIKYVEYYCNNVGDAVGGDSGVFSKVFEASLINAINKYQTQKLSVDKVFVLLSKIAHYIHFNKAYPISKQQVLKIIDQYNEDYGADVIGIDFISIATQANILVFDETLTGYRFANKNYLAYFVARELNSQYNNTGDDSDLQTVLRYACFGINADILLFVSYITDNIKILRLILQIAIEYTKDWAEFDLLNNVPNFLSMEKKHYVELPAEDAKQKEQEAEVLSEKETDKAIQTIDIYDYSEDDIDNFINQLIRASQLLTIVARCLPNFEHSMLKSDKENFIRVIYTLPNKVFNLWALEKDKEFDEIVRFFKEQSQDYYIRQKKLKDDDIVRVLQWTAMSFLLDLYNLAVFYATKENTIEYLSSFNYSEKGTYKLEHLMMLERQASADAFISEAIDATRDKNGHLYPILISRVVSHALVYRPDFKQHQVQQLQSKFFPGKESQKKILVQRMQNKNVE